MRLNPELSETFRRVAKNYLAVSPDDSASLAAKMNSPYSTFLRALTTDVRWSEEQAFGLSNAIAETHNAEPCQVFDQLKSGQLTLPFLCELDRAVTLRLGADCDERLADEFLALRRGQKVVRLSTLPPPDMLLPELVSPILLPASSNSETQSIAERRLFIHMAERAHELFMLNVERCANEVRFVWPADVLDSIINQMFPFDQIPTDLLEELVEFWQYDCINRRMTFKALAINDQGTPILRRFAEFSEVELIDSQILIRRVAGRGVWQFFDARTGDRCTRSIVNSHAQIIELSGNVSVDIDFENIRARLRQRRA